MAKCPKCGSQNIHETQLHECPSGRKPMRCGHCYYTWCEGDKHNDFLMFKKVHFQVRDGALTERAYLHFLAGYFGIIPTPGDLTIPEKGYFKIKKE